MSERRIPPAADFREIATAVPDVLLPYQQRWIADQAAVKMCEKSRRVGLSWAEAADDVLNAAQADGTNVWYIGYNLDMAKEFINDCASWCRVYQLAAGEVEEEIIKDEDKDILAMKIRMASGHRVTALSSRPTNLRGKQGIVVIDEAAFHDDLDGLIKAALALLMWGGKVRIISTHNGEANPFNELIGEVRAGKRRFSIHRITLDDALAEGLYRRICLKLGKEWSSEGEVAWRQELMDYYGDHADEELFCIPSQGTGVYLPLALIEHCEEPAIPVLRWSCTTEFATFPDQVRQAEARDWCEGALSPLLLQLEGPRRHFFGEDFGRSGDLTVIWPVAEQQNLTYRTPFVVELQNVPFKEQELILFYVVDRMPHFTGGAMDSRGNGQYLGEVAMQRYGKGRILQVMLSTEWYRDNMPRFKAWIEDGAISLPKDADIRRDLRAVRMERGVPKVPEGARTAGTSGGKRHGDAAIALALTAYATREASGYEVDFMPLGAPRERFDGYIDGIREQVFSDSGVMRRCDLRGY